MNAKDEDDLFSAQWEDAFEAGTDTLEDELTRRALTGSDACLIFALKGRRPARWRPTPQKTVMVQDPELLRDAEQTRRIREMSDEELQAEIDHIDEMRRQLNRPRGYGGNGQQDGVSPLHGQHRRCNGSLR